MELVFKSLQRGKKFYAVRLNGRELFIGTPGECERFLAIHDRKVVEERELDRKPRRSRPFLVRTFRQTRTTA